MAFGIHWEWRAFGAVSTDVVDKFSSLHKQFEPQDIEDLYLWIPGDKINAKFRKGAEGGLKFKRLKEVSGELEQWYENQDEMFEFPLQRDAWETLARALTDARVTLPGYPPEPPDRARATQYLIDAGCQTVMIRKRRTGRLWQGPSGKVKMEWACISTPQSVISIGLETWNEEPSGDSLSDAQAQEDIVAAIEHLGLKREPLKVMNYLDALLLWARKQKM